MNFLQIIPVKNGKKGTENEKISGPYERRKK